MTRKPYQYGESSRHIVYLTENQARAVNDARFYPDEGTDYTTGKVSGHLSLPDGVTLDDYNFAAAHLNSYHALFGDVPCSEEYLENHEILTPVQ